jgi:hypothetical protein
MKARRFILLPVALLGGAALAGETVAFRYDALGRLNGSSIAGGPNGGIQTQTCFDAAGNRTRYSVVSGLPSACASGFAAQRSAAGAIPDRAAGFAASSKPGASRRPL